MCAPPWKCEGATLCLMFRAAPWRPRLAADYCVRLLLSILLMSLVGAHFADHCIDQPARDGDSAWKFRQLQHIEPLRILDFSGLRADFTRLPVADEGDHQRIRKRPGLAREVADSRHLYADLLLDFARQ